MSPAADLTHVVLHAGLDQPHYDFGGTSKNTSWDNVTPQQIIADIRAAKNLLMRTPSRRQQAMDIVVRLWLTTGFDRLDVDDDGGLWCAPIDQPALMAAVQRIGLVHTILDPLPSIMGFPVYIGSKP